MVEAKQPVVCFGAGGHAGMIVELLKQYPQYGLVALVDKDPVLQGKVAYGIAVIGFTQLITELIRAHPMCYFVVGIGAAKSCILRKSVYQEAIALGMKPLSVIHSSALIMNDVLIGPGSVIMPGAIINRGVKLGCNVIVNSNSVIEHDVLIGDHSHVATAACITGGVIIGEQVLVGASSVIREKTTIASNAVIGLGSVVVSDIAIDQVVVGNPARELIKK